MNIRILPGVALFLFATALWSAEKPEITTDQQKFSYAIGFQIAQSLRRQGLEVEQKALFQAIEDVLSDTPLRVSMAEMQAAVEKYRQKQLQKLGAENEKAGDAFLAANREKEGVTELPSGVQYKIIQEGKGKKPKASDTVVVHYRGTLVNGEEFDSSYARGEPATFPINGVIEGWQQVLQLMPEGAKWMVVIPPSLAYGDQGAGNRIGPKATLVFEIELLSIN